ncbi:[protein-PII] uridylyltransferase [Denitrificimonas caeni]|uniref:Bifunctional uridylyltransferase/uridylyl-removing enzyme n=1 Tax=Denitrificimonas caeni TaxID=521720 RepID=A0AAE9VV40_9GAMM|nr:[protein-PII] uridylyltransferase [Denitrificimonas caeni]WBE26549.1 [protein-PII] uridylyltransferase [Denitrificimonas caeni]
MLPTDPELFDAAAFEQQLAADSNSLATFRSAIEHARMVLDQRFLDQHDIHDVVHARAWFIDQLLEQAWHAQNWLPGTCNIALVAVGGYGRGELHPYSDIDLLILLEHEQHEHLHAGISAFLTFLWDIGLEVGHSVRTVQQCADEASGDLSVITNLLESRLVLGPNELLVAMRELIGPQHMWPSEQFFLGKRAEQRERHTKYNDTEYNLEPNVKSSPGGLRDLQTIMWVARRRFGMRTLSSLEAPGFLTAGEYRLLSQARAFLWQVRYALHMLAGRNEDRLLLDYQHKIAHMFGYSDDDNRPAIEHFMQKYYRIIMGISQLSDLISQYFEETILRADSTELPTPLNERFRIRGGYIEACNPYVFSDTPSAILEIFVLLAQHPEIKGVRSQTIRMLRDHRHLIDDAFRHDERNINLFLELFRCTEGVHMNLRRMSRYGILGRYLPEFGRIVGQMQHDLFHIYTVDAHTLNLIKHLRKLRHPDFAEKYSLASAVIGRLPKPELIYLAGLFHDIGKGRGGNHSLLGADIAEEFGKLHQLPKADTRLITWLVRNHLVMSVTAQRKDISDPEEIHNFALLVGDQVRLDYLYVLTVADINATNPTLWNSWRAQLLRQLYSETRRALRRGLENPLEREEQISTRQATALSLLTEDGVAPQAVEQLWSQLGDDYFVRHSAGDIVWHTEAILQHGDSLEPLVLVRETTQREYDGGTQIFVYGVQRHDFFAVTVTTLDQLNLSTLDARIMTSKGHFSIETYIVLDAEGDRIGDDPERIQEIRTGLTTALRNPENFPAIIQRRVPRQLKHFSFTPQITIHNDAQRPYTIVEVIAPDRPGLLARIAGIFVEFNLSLVKAKIITLGERIEDVFFITDADGLPLSDPDLCHALQESMIAQLSTGASGTVTHLSNAY